MVDGAAGAQPAAEDVRLPALRRAAARDERAHADRARGRRLEAAARAHRVRAGGAPPRRADAGGRVAAGEPAAVPLPAGPLSAVLLPDPPTLEGARVRLEPLAASHAADLAVAAEEDRAAYGFTEVPRGAEVEAFLAAHF